MTVTPYGRATFLVESHGNTYTVDLLIDKGSGRCDCPHFRGRLQVDIKLAKENRTFKPGDEYRCPHIKAARNVMLDMFLEQMAKAFPDNSMETT